VLVSRTESKLQAVAAELAGSYGVQARTCAADLTQASPETIAKIGAALKGLDVSAVPLDVQLSTLHCAAAS
jgi:short-subunit dehydrogenase